MPTSPPVPVSESSCSKGSRVLKTDCCSLPDPSQCPELIADYSMTPTADCYAYYGFQCHDYKRGGEEQVAQNWCPAGPKEKKCGADFWNMKINMGQPTRISKTKEPTIPLALPIQIAAVINTYLGYDNGRNGTGEKWNTKFFTVPTQGPPGATARLMPFYKCPDHAGFECGIPATITKHCFYRPADQYNARPSSQCPQMGNVYFRLAADAMTVADKVPTFVPTKVRALICLNGAFNNKSPDTMGFTFAKYPWGLENNLLMEVYPTQQDKYAAEQGWGLFFNKGTWVGPKDLPNLSAKAGCHISYVAQQQLLHPKKPVHDEL